MPVSQEQLRSDIANTRKEIEAYDHLIKGFQILARLPENNPNQFRFEIMKYEKSKEGCQGFLDSLILLQHTTVKKESGD